MTMSIIEPNVLGDGTFFRAGPGTYYDAAGVLQTAAINVPRLNYDPANLTTAPQLLVEGAATNQQKFSEDFTNVAWVKTGSSTASAPNTLNFPLINQAISQGFLQASPIGSSATFGVELSGTGTIYLYLGRISGGVYEQTTLFVTLTATPTRYKVSHTMTLTGQNGFIGGVSRSANGTATTVTANRAQLETGTIGSSYIATTGSAVTRAADVVSSTGLIYSSAAENDFPEWDAPTAYALDAKVIRASTHRIYQRRVAGTTATAPDLDAINWLDIAPTNRWAMFDDKVGTMTSVTGNLTAAMRPGAVSGLALLEMAGRKATVVMKDAPGGVTVYSKTVSLDATLITSVYDWFYKDYEQMTDLVLTDLPSQFVSNELTITISSTTTASVGVCKFGELTNVGQTQYGASVGITDYSRKDVDAFGNVLITKRAFSKRADFSIVTEAADFAALFRKFTAIRATPCIFIGTEVAGFDPLIVYGFYKDFSIVVPYPSNHLCNVSIEGLI